MKKDRTTEILAQIEDLVAELRAIRLREVNDDDDKPIFPQFSKGDRVLILSRALHHHKATIDRVKGEQMWHIILDDGTRTTRKYSSLELLHEE